MGLSHSATCGCWERDQLQRFLQDLQRSLDFPFILSAFRRVFEADDIRAWGFELHQDRRAFHGDVQRADAVFMGAELSFIGRCGGERKSKGGAGDQGSPEGHGVPHFTVTGWK